MKGNFQLGNKFSYGGRTSPFFLLPEDRRLHTYIIGKTGLGKSTLLRNLIQQDIESGEGLAVLDPHGSLASQLLDDIPRHRTNDVVYFDPSDTDHPIGFNLLSQGRNLDNSVIASAVTSTFKHLWRDSWGPRLEYVLWNTIKTILDVDHGTLLSVQCLLSDENYRRRVIRRITDPSLRSFWETEFAGYREGFRAEVTAPVQNKLGRLVNSPILRNILGQTSGGLNIRHLMDTKKIVIANLSKGLIGEDSSYFLGSLLATAFHLSAMQREDQEETLREDFILYLDEFHNFGGDSFVSTLSEARKYRLSLVMAHQYMAQLSPALHQAVLGNTGTIVCFGVGPDDSETLQKHFEPYNHSVLLSLPRGQTCIRSTKRGELTEPFKLSVIPPSRSRYGRRDTVIQQSRRKYSAPRKDVEDRIRRFFRA